MKIPQPCSKGVVKVPVIMQMEAVECGAASLTMILAYYRKWLPLERLRQDCGVSRDGSTAKNLLLAARSHGLKASAFRANPEALMKEGTFPCIIHWNFNHFLVLRGFRGKYAYLNDPARGSVRVTMEEFDKAFTGICLAFAPSENFQPEGKRESIWGFVGNALSGAGEALAFVSVTSILGYLFTIWNPAASRFLMDRLLTGQNPDMIRPFLQLCGLMALLHILSAGICAVSMLKLGGKLAAIGSSTFFWKLMRLPMSFFSQRMAGDIQIRQKDNSVIAEILVNTLAPLVFSAATLLVFLVLMLRFSPLLTLIGVAGVAVNLAVSQVIAEQRVNLTRVQTRDKGKLMASTVSGIQMIETIKASGAERGYFRRWADFQSSVKAQEVSIADLDQYLGMVPGFVSGLVDGAVLVAGVWLCMRGRFSLGMLLAFQGYLLSFMSPAMTIISAGQTLQELRTYMERVEDVTRYPEDPRVTDEGVPEDADYEKLRGEVELKHISFGYSPLSPPLIQDFSMHIRPGSRVAFVGASGCGKSTLSKLISGLYSPWSGEILFDGKPISQIPRAVFTGSVAVVDQEISLFEDTVADNIKMWDGTIEDFEMIMAARDAQIHDDILRRQGGYQSRVSEGGRDLSGGQRQRLEIARVLAQDPHILIMDEATSALDARTEYEVVNAVKDRGITCIIIAHRLSTIRDCDEIVVLDHGLVVERGTHEELYAKGGYYADLISNE